MRRTIEREAGYDPYAVIVGLGDLDVGPCAHTVILSTRADADQVARLLGELGHKPWVIRLNDVERP